MSIMAIDPGTDSSAFVVLECGKIISHGYDSNEVMIKRLAANRLKPSPDLIACEMIQSFGMPVGKETFETCLWIGRFLQESIRAGVAFELIYRKDIKMHLCGSMRAKDGNIRQALIDRMGPQGTKKSPGPTYGIKSHTWAALAVAVYAMDTIESK